MIRVQVDISSCHTVMSRPIPCKILSKILRNQIIKASKNSNSLCSFLLQAKLNQLEERECVCLLKFTFEE